ncbi:MAG: metallophosphoesterase [Pirellulales bacterium]|nr:metallophosphoesterase [Pirellulales bacterium]
MAAGSGIALLDSPMGWADATDAYQRQLAARRKEYLQWMVEYFGKLEPEMQPFDGRHWSLNQARLSLGVELEKANQYFETVKKRPIGDPDFPSTRYLKTLLDFHNSQRLSRRAKDNLMAIFLNWKMNKLSTVARWPAQFTENHDLMYLTIGLFAELFRGHDMSKHIKELSKSLAWRFERGWVEWNSHRYQYHYSNPLMILAAHAPSANLRKGAADLMNLLLAERALLGVGGYLGGPFLRGYDRNRGRTYGKDNACAYYEDHRYDAFLPTVWLAFGLGEPRFDFDKAGGLAPAGDGFGNGKDPRLNQDEGTFFATHKLVPHPVIRALAAESATRQELIYKGRRNHGWPVAEVCPALLYYYNTPHVSMGSQQAFGYSFQARFMSVFFSSEPAKSLRVVLLDEKKYHASDHRNERGELVQHKNWLMARGELVADGSIESQKSGPWNLYCVDKGLCAHKELPGGLHVMQISDLDKYPTPGAFLAALTVPAREENIVEGKTADGDNVRVDVNDMSISVNNKPRVPWTGMLHDSESMRSVHGSGVVKIKTKAGELKLTNRSLKKELANAGDQPLLRFVQWNDIHIRAQDSKKSQQKLEFLVNSINDETYFSMPDFVIGVGDIIEGGSAAARKTEFGIFASRIAGLKCPFYPVIGNHENNAAEGNSTNEAEYVAAFGSHRRNYTFQAGGVRFIMLNNSGAPGANRSAAGTARRKWLQKALDKSPGVPKIIACHIPLVPVRDEKVLAKSFGFGKLYCAHDADLLKIVEDRKDDVLAVLSGHVHLSGAVRRNGIYHITTSGTDDYPCDFAEYKVYKDRLCIQMHAISKDLRQPSRNLHARTGAEYTDSTHATPDLYVSGNPSERAFEIVFRNNTQPRGTPRHMRKPSRESE